MVPDNGVKIRSYADLKGCEGGKVISINGRTEVIIDPFAAHLHKFGSPKARIYTVSMEGDWVVQNYYCGESLEPFMKTCCKIGCGTGLEYSLFKIAEKGGLIMEDAKEKR